MNQTKHYTSMIALLILLILSDLGFSSDQLSAARKESLRGLKGISVFVEDLKFDNIPADLTKYQIQTDVELKLSLAGIKVLHDEFFKTPGHPYLSISVHIMDLDLEKGYIWNISVELIQDVLLLRNFEECKCAVTWHHSALGKSSDLKNIRKYIKEDVDIFVKDYLSVNPKKPATH